MIVAYLAPSADTAAVAAPTTAPSNVSLYYYSGSLIGVQWTNGDATASTQVGFGVDGAEPASASATVPAGATSYETGESGTIDGSAASGTSWWVRHTKGGSNTAWVESAEVVT